MWTTVTFNASESTHRLHLHVNYKVFSFFVSLALRLQLSHVGGADRFALKAAVLFDSFSRFSGWVYTVPGLVCMSLLRLLWAAWQKLRLLSISHHLFFHPRPGFLFHCWTAERHQTVIKRCSHMAPLPHYHHSHTHSDWNTLDKYIKYIPDVAWMERRRRHPKIDYEGTVRMLFTV